MLAAPPLIQSNSFNFQLTQVEVREAARELTISGERKRAASVDAGVEPGRKQVLEREMGRFERTFTLSAKPTRAPCLPGELLGGGVTWLGDSLFKGSRHDWPLPLCVLFQDRW